MPVRYALFPLALALSAPALSEEAHHHHGPMAGMVHADVIAADGKTIGMAMLQQAAGGVLITLDVAGLTPGEHAVHVHEKGTCDGAAGFTSAGGHFGPGNAAHGFTDAKGPHAGDMPNQFVAADGKLKAHILNTAVALGTSGQGALGDADGSALVIHGGADDYKSQPAGNAGPRVACAVIAAPRK